MVFHALVFYILRLSVKVVAPPVGMYALSSFLQIQRTKRQKKKKASRMTTMKKRRMMMRKKREKKELQPERPHGQHLAWRLKGNLTAHGHK